MRKTHRLLCAALSLLAMSVYADPIETTEIFVDETGKLHTPRGIQTALDSSFPGFQHWSVSDYHEGLRKPELANRRGTIAPYALVLDFNGDARDDLVVSGHDRDTHLLLCVISSKTGYSAQAVHRGRPIPVPASIESWKDGRRDVGLNIVLSLPPPDRKDWAFVIDYLPETWMHPVPPAAQGDAQGVGVMFSKGRCAVDDRDVSPDVH